MVSDRFHQRVDKHPNLLSIARTKKGRVFGGFNSLPLNPQRGRSDATRNLQDKSFLFSIQKGELKFFDLKPDCRGLVY